MSSNLSEVTELLWGRAGQGFKSRSVYSQILLGGDHGWLSGSEISPCEHLHLGDCGESPGLFLPTSVAAWDTGHRYRQENSIKWLPQTLVKIWPLLEDEEPSWLWCSAWNTHRSRRELHQLLKLIPPPETLTWFGAWPGGGDFKLPSNSNAQPRVRPTH